MERVTDQTERRVLRGETVFSAEKVVTLFEPRTDIIAKRGYVHYGDKLNLSAGASGVVLDAVIERRNPADTRRLIPMLERHPELYGAVPAQVACGRVYASTANSRRCEGAGRRGHGVPQEAGSGSAGDGVLGGGLRPAQEVPGRAGGGDLVSEALLRALAVQLAGLGALPGLRVVDRRHPLSGRSRPKRAETQAGVAPGPRGGTAPDRLRESRGLPRLRRSKKHAPEARKTPPVTGAASKSPGSAGQGPRRTSREQAFMDRNYTRQSAPSTLPANSVPR